MNRRITLGTNFYPTAGDEARRQRAAQESWLSLPACDLVDLQFAREPARLDLPGVRRVEALTLDSIGLTGAPGKRKPIISEVFDVLAREALTAGNALFAYANADIVLTPAVVAECLAASAGGCQALIFSRMDFDGRNGADIEMVYQGQDVFVLDAAWWLENRWRFRPYVVGDLCWDNVYSSILLCHATTRLENRTPWVRHEQHPVVWFHSPFRPHNEFLLTLDSYYFSDWCDYCNALGKLRAAGAGEDTETALLQRSFQRRRTGLAHLERFGRGVRAFWRRWVANAARGRFQVPPHRSVYR